MVVVAAVVVVAAALAGLGAQLWGPQRVRRGWRSRWPGGDPVHVVASEAAWGPAQLRWPQLQGARGVVGQGVAALATELGMAEALPVGAQL